MLDASDFEAKFRLVAVAAARDNGMVGGAVDRTGQIHFAAFTSGGIAGHRGAIEKGLLPADLQAAFSIFVDSNGKPIGIHWKSGYNLPEAGYIPPAELRRSILDVIPHKPAGFFESGLE